MGKLWRSFSKDKPETYQEAYSRALEQIQLDEQYRIKIEHDESRSSKRQKGDNTQKKDKEPIAKRRDLPPNRSTYRLPPLPPNRARPFRRVSPPRRIRWTPFPVKEVARIA